MVGGERVDDTPVHKALREALANCLINADYHGLRGVVIRKEPDKLILANPGYVRTGKKQMRLGGESDPRNKALMKMFNLINIGERAGSGVPNIFNVWADEGWEEPVIEERFDPDRTVLSLSFLKKEDAKMKEDANFIQKNERSLKEVLNQKDYEKALPIIEYLETNSVITTQTARQLSQLLTMLPTGSVPEMTTPTQPLVLALHPTTASTASSTAKPQARLPILMSTTSLTVSASAVLRIPTISLLTSTPTLMESANAALRIPTTSLLPAARLPKLLLLAAVLLTSTPSYSPPASPTVTPLTQQHTQPQMVGYPQTLQFSAVVLPI